MRVNPFAFFAVLFATPIPANAAPLSPDNFQALAARCAPSISASLLKGVAATESGLQPWVLHDDTTGQVERPKSVKVAEAEAVQWVARGDSVDIGLMQINSANLRALRMTVVTALDPCASLSGGAAILEAAYSGGDSNAEQQAALLMALSRYNTGSSFAGIMNGYARTVIANAEGDPFGVPFFNKTVPENVNPNAPPTWDISASGNYAQSHGAVWLVDLAPVQTPHVGR